MFGKNTNKRKSLHASGGTQDLLLSVVMKGLRICHQLSSYGFWCLLLLAKLENMNKKASRLLSLGDHSSLNSESATYFLGYFNSLLLLPASKFAR